MLKKGLIWFLLLAAALALPSPPPIAGARDLSAWAGKMHVQGMNQSYVLQGSVYAVTARVRIVSGQGRPVSGATVSVEYTLPDASKVAQQRQTGASGIAGFRVRSALTGIYGVCVTDVVKTDWYYDSGQNVVTCNQTRVPNRPPNPPSAPAPADGATGQSDYVQLAWADSDPDGDALTYDVYVRAGDTITDVLACDDTSARACAPGPLECGTQYSWHVIAVDAYGATAEGPPWSFATRGLISPPPGERAEGLPTRYTGSPDNGVAIIEFADTFESAYTLAYPALEARDMAGTVYVNVVHIVDAWRPSWQPASVTTSTHTAGMSPLMAIRTRTQPR